jgi:serine protease Do
MNTIALLLLVQIPNPTAGDLDPYQRRITPEVRVVQHVAPSVVFITTQGRQQFRDFWGRTGTQRVSGSGSGVVIHKDGYIVTNYHVVRNAEDGITVTFDPTYGDEREYPAQLISHEPEEDLALLKIEGDAPFKRVDLGTSADLMIGERVLAIGNPYGQTHTVSTGIISGLHREVLVDGNNFSELIQTDAAINPGNSGGPLVNINGELIGINTVMNKAAENIGFAIPVDEVTRVLTDKLLSPSLARAWLGYEVDLGTLEVTRVIPGSPADEAGLLVADKILAVGAKPISTDQEYRYARLDVLPNRSVRIGVERNGERIPLVMTTWERVRGLLFERLGLEVEELTISAGWRTQRYLRVTNVRPDGPAERLGLQPGDIIDAVTPRNGRMQQVRSTNDLAYLVNRLEVGAVLDLDLWRDLDADGLLERTDEYSELFQGPIELE